MEIIEEKESPFFKRKDLKIILKHHGTPTPSKSEVVKELAGKYGVDELQVQVKYISSKRGSGESLGSVKILKEKPKVEIKQEPKSETNEAQASTTE